MKSIHLNEAAHAFSGYATRHPFHCAMEAIGGVALIALLSGVVVAASEPTTAAPAVSKVSVERHTDSAPKWVWAKHVDRGLHVYPIAP